MSTMSIKATQREPAFHAINAAPLKIGKSLFFFLPTIAFYFYILTGINLEIWQEGLNVNDTFNTAEFKSQPKSCVGFG